MSELLNDREWASVILLVGFALIIACIPSVRRSVGPSIKALLAAATTPKILVIFGGFIVWIAAVIWLAASWRFWQFDLIKDSVVVAATVGFPLLFKAVEAAKGAAIGSLIRRGTVSRATLLAFYLNLETLPLPIELLLQSALVVVALATVSKPRGKIVAGVIYLLIVIGLTIWTVAKIATTWDEADRDLAIGALAMSIWLPAAMFPYLYLAALYAHLEMAFLRLSDFGRRRLRFGTRLGVLLGLRLSVRWATQLNGSYSDIGREETLKGTLRKMSEFRDDVERREAARADKLAVLEANVGVDGVDETGARLDRQEFKVTKDRLEWIWTTQTGRYAQIGNRYWDDLNDMMVDPVRHGLPLAHGFVTEITADGQRWRSWRPTPSGWVLGIGGVAVGSQYLYQGPKPPESWPGDADWANTAVEPWPRDWQKYDGPVL